MLPLRMCQSLASEERAPAVSALAYQPAKHTHAVTLSTRPGSADRYLFKAWLGSQKWLWQEAARWAGAVLLPAPVAGRRQEGMEGLALETWAKNSPSEDVSPGGGWLSRPTK